MEVLVVLAALHVAAAVVTALKGKPWFLLLGLVVGWFWFFGSLRLAKPDSWWARRFYQGDKLQQSRVRYGRPSRALEPAPAAARRP